MGLDQAETFRELRDNAYNESGRLWKDVAADLESQLAVKDARIRVLESRLRTAEKRVK